MHKLFLYSALLICVGALGAGAGFYAGTTQADKVAEALARSEAASLERFSALEDVLFSLSSNTEFLEEAFVAANAKTLEREVEAKQLVEALSAQESRLTSFVASSDITSLIKTWSPFVYHLSCAFTFTDGKEGESGGSAVLIRTASGIRFITNKHVVEEKGVAPDECILSRLDSDGTFTISREMIITDEERDYAEGAVPGGLLGVLSSQVCSQKPEIGDRVVMLGYPTIGGTESVTATEGILSGFDEEYYTTSAKIEKGNSGGAAIHVEQGCLLGLPTLVFAGRIESIARILPVSPF